MGEHGLIQSAPRACGEPDARTTGTSGSGGRPEKRTGRKTGTALQADLTTWWPIPRSFWWPGIGCAATGVRETPGVDRRTASAIARQVGVEDFLDTLRSALKDRSFRPLPLREQMIPKPGGKQRRLGIATITDRVVQASLKLVLEPIFETDFFPCSYGFRPNRRAHDAVAEVRHFTSHSYEWIVEGDIKACFDEIDHTALMDRVRRRIADKRVLTLVKAFLKSGILDEDGRLRDNDTGTRQGSILSPLLSNVALSVLDEFVAQEPGGPQTGPGERAKRRRHGLPNHRLMRYADDWCLVISGSRSDAEALKEKITGVLATMGLRLSPDKTLITHIDQGLDFGAIHRHRKRGRTGTTSTPTRRKRPYGPSPGRSRRCADRSARTNPGCPAPPAQPGGAGLVWLLPARGVLRDLCLPRPLPVVSGLALATPQTPQDHLEGHPPPLLPQRIMAGQPQSGTAQPHHGRHQPLPLRSRPTPWPATA